MKVAVLLSRVRVEERWIFEALEKRNIPYDKIDDRQAVLLLSDPDKWKQYDVVIERSLSFKNGLYITQVLNSWGIPTVNMYRVAATCGDKLTTSVVLNNAGIPQPKVWVAFTPKPRWKPWTRSAFRSS
jgi:[lysine-biosynthesis-protein LysW]--L-2-aminoadipate ligase